MESKVGMNSAGRLKWIDSCKGFATLLVVTGHVADGYLNAGIYSSFSVILQTIYNWIYSFHMALFFALSGYVFCISYGTCATGGLNKTKRYRNQMINLISVYIFFSLLLWIFKVIFSSDVNTVLTFRDLIRIPVVPVSPYWYLWNLIIYYLYFFYIRKKISDMTAIFFATLAGLAGAYLPYQTTNMPSCLYYLLFFGLGIFLARTGCKIFSNFLIVTGCIAVSAIATYLMIARHMKPDSVGINLIVALCMTLSVLYFFEHVVSENQLPVFRVIGTYALEIYLIHCFITAGNRKLLPMLGITDFYLSVVVNAVTATVIPVVCAAILKKMKLHQVIFKPAVWLTCCGRH